MSGETGEGVGVEGGKGKGKGDWGLGVRLERRGEGGERGLLGALSGEEGMMARCLSGSARLRPFPVRVACEEAVVGSVYRDGRALRSGRLARDTTSSVGRSPLALPTGPGGGAGRVSDTLYPFFWGSK